MSKPFTDEELIESFRAKGIEVVAIRSVASPDRATVSFTMDGETWRFAVTGPITTETLVDMAHQIIDEE